MFDDNRTKRIVLVAHCLLNQNSISDGTADFPSQFKELVTLLMNARIGMIQLPCPELLCLGLDRGDKSGGNRTLLQENTRIRNLMQSRESVSFLKIIIAELIGQLEDYGRYDFELVGLIGVNRSPSCGIETTTRDGKEVDGKGVFMEILQEECKGRCMGIKMVGVESRNWQESLEKVSRMLSCDGKKSRLGGRMRR